MIRYDIAVKTGDVRSSGADANVFIIIYGEKGDTGELSKAQYCTMNLCQKSNCGMANICHGYSKLQRRYLVWPSNT